MPTTTEQKKLVKKGEKEDFPEPSKKPICENSSNVDDENPKIMFVNKSAKLELPPVFSDEFFVWKRTFWQRKFDECEIKRIVAPMVDQRFVCFIPKNMRKRGYLSRLVSSPFECL
jgi:hypothetical protein